ncbi:tRNA (guanosine(46)-N7)-methyltransferase TrmB [Rhodococcus artemisiae]|uniref:tRNA (guanine-N(7)-)-methyltransferase n=1 Tax=Rhodococcus artemisiae TaxID=714159 RepID=A0ABU7L694_9NOCA|nr:tRNA (guanosine(46)-N7)-methyltransferase TrmB [Rhodococcus artemisiae]MEE2057033.1 tRNA (guanosine(46)-N7)-methyltransferase TrmB [Rhodococcus artemisiae]
MPRTLPIRDNGRVNHADQDTTDTLDEQQSRGNRLYPRVTSFRSRRGSLTDPQQDAWDRRWPELGRDVGDDLLDADTWFGRSAPLVLEIGSGTGTAAVAMAQAEPHINLIAIEVYRPGIAQTLQRIERTSDTDAPVSNLRILRGDAVEVLEHMIAPESLTGVRVFFPDPWPKARHHKRRLLQPKTFTLIASRLKPGGVLHVATDHAEYAEWILEAGNAEPQLTDVTWESPVSHERPVTKFEDKAHQVGSHIAEMIWGKIGA